MLHRSILASILAPLALVLCALGAPAPARAMELVTVYAAASTKPVIDALTPAMEQRRLAIRAVHAGTATLARQIELGAPDVDVFISANVKWMDYLHAQGLLEPGARRDVATNRLVLIAAAAVPANTTLDLTDASNAADAIARVLNGERLAIAEPDTVPAGIYGKEALQALHAWDRLKDRLAPTRDVTGALLLVARGETPLGLVYQSDARRVAGVRIVGVFPAASHTPIVYQAALLKGRASDAPLGLLDVLTGPQGQAAFGAAGFGGRP